jgi:hypothetical protein
MNHTQNARTHTLSLALGKESFLKYLIYYIIIVVIDRILVANIAETNNHYLIYYK